MKHLRALALLTGTFAILFALAGCDPQEGDTCKDPGSFTTRVHGSHRTSLSCQPSGVDQHGNQEYRWVKA